MHPNLSLILKLVKKSKSPIISYFLLNFFSLNTFFLTKTVRIPISYLSKSF